MGENRDYITAVDILALAASFLAVAGALYLLHQIGWI
jgi:hypothetical protein